MQIGGKIDELMYFRGCSLEFGRTYVAFVYIEASNGMVIDGGLMSGGVDIVVRICCLCFLVLCGCLSCVVSFVCF